MELKVINTDQFYEYLDGIVRLYNTTFKNKVDRAYYIWRYIDIPQNDLLIGLAIDDGKIVSSYSYIPVNLELHNVSYKAALAIHLMTHPDYKGQGLSAKIYALLTPCLVERGYRMERGFPNQISHAYHVQQLGWKDIYEFPTMSREVTGEPATDPEVIRDDSFQLDYSKIKRDPEKIRVDKNIRFLQWRYSACPTTKYLNYVIAPKKQVRAYATIKKYENKINLVDHFYTDEKDMQKLLSAVSGYALEQKAEFITTWANINSDFKLFLDINGFQPALPITYCSGKILDESTPLNYCAQDWDTFMGDDNVY